MMPSRALKLGLNRSRVASRGVFPKAQFTEIFLVDFVRALGGEPRDALGSQLLEPFTEEPIGGLHVAKGGGHEVDIDKSFGVALPMEDKESYGLHIS